MLLVARVAGCHNDRLLIFAKQPVCNMVTDKSGFATTADEAYPQGRLPYDTYVISEENASWISPRFTCSLEVTSSTKTRSAGFFAESVGKGEPQGAASLENAVYDIFRKRDYKAGDTRKAAQARAGFAPSRAGSAS